MIGNDHLFLYLAAENRPDAFSAFWAEAVQTKIDAWALLGQAGCPLLVQSLPKKGLRKRQAEPAESCDAAGGGQIVFTGMPLRKRWAP